MCGANPTDTRTQKMVGAIWTAMVLRMDMLNNVSYNVYFKFPGGVGGFGMVNWNTTKPYYPYYVNKMIGTNLAVGDNVIESNSYSDLRTLSWINNGKINILLIHNSTATETISLQGVAGSFNYQKIDNTYPFDNAQVQIGTIDASDTITLNGYTVMLLQESISPTTTTTTIPSDTERPKWSNFYRIPLEPTIITTLDSVTINVTWYDNQSLGTVIIWENSTGWKGHVVYP
jgi:hypothetical protein